MNKYFGVRQSLLKLRDTVCLRVLKQLNQCGYLSGNLYFSLLVAMVSVMCVLVYAGYHIQGVLM